MLKSVLSTLASVLESLKADPDGVHPGTHLISTYIALTVKQPSAYSSALDEKDQVHSLSQPFFPWNE